MVHFIGKKPSRPPPPPPDTNTQHRPVAPLHMPSSSWTCSARAHPPGNSSTMSNLTSSMRLRNERVLPPPPPSSMMASSSIKKPTNGSIIMDGPSGPYLPLYECHTGPPPKPEKPLKFSKKQQQLNHFDTATTAAAAPLSSAIKPQKQHLQQLQQQQERQKQHHQQQQQQQHGYHTSNNRSRTLSTSISTVEPITHSSSATLSHQKSRSCGVESSEIQYLSLYMDTDKLSLNEKNDHPQKKQQPQQSLPPSMQSIVYRQVDFVKTEALNKCKRR